MGINNTTQSTCQSEVSSGGGTTISSENQECSKEQSKPGSNPPPKPTPKPKTKKSSKKSKKNTKKSSHKKTHKTHKSHHSGSKKKSKEKSHSKKSKSKSKQHCHHKCKVKKHHKRRSRKLTKSKKSKNLPILTAKGKLPPGQSSRLIQVDPNMYNTQHVTTFYVVPSENFKDETDVAKYNNFQILLDQQLGKGGFATVFKAVNLKNDKPAACKVVHIKSMEHLEEMKNELIFMEKVNNPFSVKVYLHYMVNDNLYIFMMLADAGCFNKHIEKEGPLTEKDAKYFFAMMCAGIEHLHDIMIAHRDIKPDNFLMYKFKDQLVLMVSDYGLSSFVHQDGNGNIEYSDSQCGTPLFMAPEILKHEAPYNPFLADVWALGVSLYMMMCNTPPFDARKTNYGVEDMIKENWDFCGQIKDKPSEELSTVTVGMLTPDPNKRLTLKQTIEHPFVASNYHEVKELEKNIAKHS